MKQFNNVEEGTTKIPVLVMGIFLFSLNHVLNLEDQNVSTACFLVLFTALILNSH